jgi:two-component system nitrogen regulation sensor histidine kinase NtrY
MVTRKARLLVWWRRTGMGLRASIFLIAIVLLGSLVYLQRPQEESPFVARNLLFFILVNLNIIIICVLAFLIGRNVVKLIFDRRRKVLGSKLKLRLAVAFVGLTLVPTIFLFVLASGLLNRVMEGWFSSQIEMSVSGAVDVARFHYASLREGTAAIAERLSQAVPAAAAQAKTDLELKEWAENRRRAERLFGLRILDGAAQELLLVRNAAAAIPNFQEPEPDRDALVRALGGATVVLFEEQEASQFVRAYTAVDYRGRPAVLVATTRVNPELAQALAEVSDSYKEYEQLKLFRMPIKSSLLLTLAMITCLILFAAIWIGFYIAREIAVPIQRLAEGTRAVAKGDYDFQIRVKGDDEIGMLVKLFNSMTRDLKLSRQDALQRRLYIETILANLAVGVVGLDTRGLVTSVNDAAAQLLGLKAEAHNDGRTLQELLHPDVYQQIAPLVSGLGARQENDEPVGTRESEIVLNNSGRELKIVCTAGQIVNPDHEPLGTVLLFDDVTELAKAQHMSVWREVARRIAHEIKNPLTPIQLSAQRLRRLVVQGEHATVVDECAQTIVENVDSIKRLANEFSNFARMPTAELKQTNLNVLIADAIAPFAESHSEIVFQFIADNMLPPVAVDAEQLRRCVMNLLDNAIAAFDKISGRSATNEAGRIVIKTLYDRSTKQARIEVIDNGPGIPDSDKTRIFEPYFTTKTGGTGLGLAIVTSIVADHQGTIRVYDNQPRGAKFIIDLPLTPKSHTQRRLLQA